MSVYVGIGLGVCVCVRMGLGYPGHFLTHWLANFWVYSMAGPKGVWRWVAGAPRTATAEARRLREDQERPR